MYNKFLFDKIKEGARAKDFEIAIEWLQDCGLITKVYKVSKAAMPLKAYIDFSSFKLFLLDVGLLSAMSDLDAKSILEKNRVFTEFKGALAEENLRAKSLKFYYEKYAPEEAVRTSMSDYREQEWMKNIPLWAITNL